MANEQSVRAARGSGEVTALDHEPMVSTRVGSAELVRTRDRVMIQVEGQAVELGIAEARAVAAALLQLTR